MRSIFIIILHALVMQIHAKELVLNHSADVKELVLNHAAGVQDFTDTFVNKLVDKLVDKLLANIVQTAAVPQASRPRIPGRTLPSSFTSPRAAGPALAPHVRYSVVPNAATNQQSSKQAPFAFPGDTVRPEEAKAKASIRDWAKKYRSLLKRGLKPKTPQEAFKMMQTPFFPAKLVDVRREGQFTTGHPKGAINVPLLQVVQGNSAFDWTKRLISYSTGVQPTERNPEFQAEAFKQLERNQPIIIVCNRGGTMENLVDDKKATEPKRYTASLKAASELYDAGFNNLFFLEGGFNKWEREGFPVEGDDPGILSSIPNLGAVLWIPAQIPLYFGLVAIARNFHLIQ
jgi:rhodanese-related sulfurtransferase